MREDEYWQAVVDRDSQSDRTFVYAVRSTGIYCLPPCPSRQPRRENALFFPNLTKQNNPGFLPASVVIPIGFYPTNPTSI
ncbi:MAG: hypothetical protein IGR93_14905 [Hydrococcus sp. C42_A2020_068]|nr:hypothetical protein [Hydrococcus sp. C42_A2020_068]